MYAYQHPTQAPPLPNFQPEQHEYMTSPTVENPKPKRTPPSNSSNQPEGQRPKTTDEEDEENMDTEAQGPPGAAV